MYSYSTYIYIYVCVHNTCIHIQYACNTYIYSNFILHIVIQLQTCVPEQLIHLNAILVTSGLTLLVLTTVPRTAMHLPNSITYFMKYSNKYSTNYQQLINTAHVSQYQQPFHHEEHFYMCRLLSLRHHWS